MTGILGLKQRSSVWATDHRANYSASFFDSLAGWQLVLSVAPELGLTSFTSDVHFVVCVVVGRLGLR